MFIAMLQNSIDLPRRTSIRKFNIKWQHNKRIKEGGSFLADKKASQND
jgi:hypothetical protein